MKAKMHVLLAMVLAVAFFWQGERAFGVALNGGNLQAALAQVQQPRNSLELRFEFQEGFTIDNDEAWQHRDMQGSGPPVQASLHPIARYPALLTLRGSSEARAGKISIDMDRVQSISASYLEAKCTPFQSLTLSTDLPKLAGRPAELKEGDSKRPREPESNNACARPLFDQLSNAITGFSNSDGLYEFMTDKSSNADAKEIILKPLKMFSCKGDGATTDPPPYRHRGNERQITIMEAFGAQAAMYPIEFVQDADPNQFNVLEARDLTADSGQKTYASPMTTCCRADKDGLEKLYAVNTLRTVFTPKDPRVKLGFAMQSSDVRHGVFGFYDTKSSSNDRAVPLNQAQALFAKVIGKDEEDTVTISVDLQDPTDKRQFTQHQRGIFNEVMAEQSVLIASMNFNVQKVSEEPRRGIDDVNGPALGVLVEGVSRIVARYAKADMPRGEGDHEQKGSNLILQQRLNALAEVVALLRAKVKQTESSTYTRNTSEGDRDRVVGNTIAIRLQNLEYGITLVKRLVANKHNPDNRLQDLTAVVGVSGYLGMALWINCKSGQDRTSIMHSVSVAFKMMLYSLEMPRTAGEGGIDANCRDVLFFLAARYQDIFDLDIAPASNSQLTCPNTAGGDVLRESSAVEDFLARAGSLALLTRFRNLVLHAQYSFSQTVNMCASGTDGFKYKPKRYAEKVHLRQSSERRTGPLAFSPLYYLPPKMRNPAGNEQSLTLQDRRVIIGASVLR